MRGDLWLLLRDCRRSGTTTDAESGRTMWRMRKQAGIGDTVQIRYTGTCEDGAVCLTSAGRAPLQFVLGRRKLIAGVENAVVGMQIGQTRTVTVQPRDAFGERRDGMLVTVRQSRIQTDTIPEIGQRIWITGASGREMPATVVEVSPMKVTLDTNHPLAGKAITFEIHLVGILQPSDPGAREAGPGQLALGPDASAVKED